MWILYKSNALCFVVKNIHVTPPPKKKNKELEYTMDSFLGLPKYVWEGIQCDIL